MSKVKLLKAIGDAADIGRSGHAPPNALNELGGLAHSKQVIDEADAAGLATATQGATDAARKAQRSADVADAAEAAVRAAADGSTTSARWLKRITKPVRARELAELWDRFSPRDVTKLIREMIRRADDGKQVIHHFVAGAIREIVAKHVGGVRRIVLAEKLRIRAIGRSDPNASFIDTGTMGDVHLPTKTLDANGRSIELGTDRIIGIGRGKPQEVTVTFPSDKKARKKTKVWVQGELEVTIAIEVKGRTVGAGGLKQVEALMVEGRGLQGYAMIDGKLWLLKYDPAKVQHVIVVPPGHPDVARIKDIQRLSGGGTLQVIDIPKELDDQIMGMARLLMKELEEDQKAAKAAVQAAASANRTP